MIATVFPGLVRDAAVPSDLPFTFIYDTDIETLAREFADRTGNTIEFSRQVWAQSTGVGLSGALIMNAASGSWAPVAESQRAKIAAHEIYHVAQHAWIGGDLTGRVGDHAVPRGGPRWLIEGSAELAGYRAAAAAGFFNFAGERAGQVSRSKGTTAPLRDLELLAGINNAGAAAYPLSFVAVEYLIREAGPESLPRYWRLIAAGQPWQQAFQTEFRRSIDMFYAEFEQFRSAL
jgi:hypothetical protein